MKNKKWIAILLGVLAALAACWAFIHRRVIRAAVTGEPMPKCPHPLPGCMKKCCPAGQSGEETPTETAPAAEPAEATTEPTETAE